MLQYFKELVCMLKKPVSNQDSTAYFVGRSHLLFITLGIIVLMATGAFFLDDHKVHESDGKSGFCISGLLVTISTVSFALVSMFYLIARLYFAFWRGRGVTPWIIMQIGILVPVLLAVFTRMFSLPAYLIPKSGNVSIAVTNLVSLLGFLFAGQATYKLLHIVNANFK